MRRRIQVLLVLPAMFACAATGEPISSGEIADASTTWVNTSTTFVDPSTTIVDATTTLVDASTASTTGQGGSSSTGEATTSGASFTTGSGGSSETSASEDESTTGEEVESEAIGWASVPADGFGGVIGGAGGPTVVVTSIEAFLEAAAGDEPKVIQISGTISGNAEISSSNKTIEGLEGSQWNGGLALYGTAEAPLRNVILRNLRIIAPSCETDCEDLDALSIRWANHVWIDHCDLWDGTDGNLDITRESDYVTVSWCRFSYTNPDQDLRQSNLVGGSDDHVDDVDDLRVTFHHNWWTENVEKNMPRIRFGLVHLFNNYYTATENADCIRIGLEANVLIENNVFQGSALPLGEEPDETAVFRAIGNVAEPEPEAAGDIEVGEVFSPPYSYVLDAPSAVPERVRAEAGPPW